MSENIYKTKQRELVMACLKSNSSRSMTVDELIEQLKNEGSSVGRATVYRCLDKLVEDGCVRKFAVHRGESAGYQFVEHNEDCHGHFHLKCTECGELVHLSCDYMKDIDKHILEHHGFTVDNKKTVLYGLCAHCNRRLRKEG